MADVTRYETVRLNNPDVVAAFEGWPDAGKVSSGVVGYLRDRLKATRLASIKPDDFYVFQAPGLEALRPQASIENGLVQELDLPLSDFWAWRNDRGGHDLVLLLGVEPHLRWNEYADSVLDFATEVGVRRLLTVGGVYDRVPHTVPPVISAVCNDPELAAELNRLGASPTTYNGPSSIHTLLVFRAGQRRVKAASLWGHAPFYIQQPNTKVCHGVLRLLVAMTKVDIDLSDLARASDHLDEQVSQAVAQKPELRDYLKRLEEQYRAGDARGEPMDDDVVDEVEDFLRRVKGDEE
ncbi:MAG: PAC2 family protein [Chloroflexota bacterium]|nr:PAC2 family protein [Chloroflexota bacterium]